LFFFRRSPLIFRKPARTSSVGIFSSGELLAMAGTTRCRNASSSGIVLLPYGFGKTW